MPCQHSVTRHPRPGGRGPGAAPVVAGLRGPVSRCANSFPDPGRYVVVVGDKNRQCGRAAPGSTLRQGYPCTWRLRQAGTTPSQLIPGGGRRPRPHRRRGRGAASRACARRRRRSCRRRPSVPPPRAARQCRAGVVMEVGPRRSAARCLNHPIEESRDNVAHHAPGMTRHDGVGLRSMLCTTAGKCTDEWEDTTSEPAKTAIFVSEPPTR
ncbi:hypothetical protein ACVWWN_007356 [Mycobacterium sp. URHB0021]